MQYMQSDPADESEGFLKLCLYSGEGLDLRAMLRGGCSDEEIAEAVTNVIERNQRNIILQKMDCICRESDRKMRIPGRCHRSEVNNHCIFYRNVLYYA